MGRPAYECPDHLLVCQDQCIVAQGPSMLEKTLSVIDEKTDVWPQATSWKDEIRNILACPVGLDKHKPQTEEATQSISQATL